MIRLLLAALLTAAYSQPFSFIRDIVSYRPPWPEGKPLIWQPNFALVADVTGDGKEDLVTGSQRDSSASVFVGGSGPVRRLSVPLAFAPYSVDVHDVDGDGRKDIVYWGFNGSQTELRFQRALGDGHFDNQARASHFDGYSSMLRFGDVNRDGKMDLIRLQFPSRITYLGRGDGTFVQQFEDGGCNCGVIDTLLVDFDKDGILDTLDTVIHFLFDEYWLVIRRGDGGGAFPDKIAEIQLVQPTAAFATAVVADLNGDGRNDLVIGRTIYLADASARLTLTRDLPVAEARAVSALDLNGDGKQDLILSVSRSAGFLRGKGDGTFEAAEYRDAGVFFEHALRYDWNGDGTLDLILHGVDLPSLSVLTGLPNAEFAEPALIGSSIQIGQAFAGNFSGREQREILVLDRTRRRILLFSAESWNGRDAGAFPLDVPGWLDAKPAIADFDGDGRDDLALPSAEGILLMYSRGDAGFAFETIKTDQAPAAVIATDFNRDGRIDLICSFPDGSVQFYSGGGAGKFNAALAIRIPQPDIIRERVWPGGFLAGDFNSDGISDLIVTHWSSSPNSAYLLHTLLYGQRDGTLTPDPSPHRDGRVVGGGAAADFNNDGKLDLLMDLREGTVMLNGLGNGRFSFAGRIDPGQCTCHVTVADLDQDSKLDLAVVDNRATMTFWKNVGGLQPVGPGPIGLGRGAVTILATDWDRNGKPDLVVPTHDGDLFLFRNAAH